MGMEIDRKTLAGIARGLRKMYGPRGVRLLRHVVRGPDGELREELVHLVDSLMVMASGAVLLWNDRNGSTHVTRIY